MVTITVIVGILFGLWCYGRQAISWAFILFHTAAFGSRQDFYNLYDAADDETSFKWYRAHNQSVKKYADYIRLHSDAHDASYKIYQNTVRSLKRSMLVKIMPISLLPTVLFWTNWYYYIIGVVLAIVYLVIYELVRNGLRARFYQRLVIFTVLNTYSKTTSR